VKASVTVYGASDDLIEVAGDISEEFPWQKRGYGQPPGDLLAFSDGTILRIEFTDAGVWRITPVVSGTAMLFIELAPEGDDSNYTDKATLTGDISWVVQGIDYAPKGH
jgi:hypothetical protein